MEKLKLGKFMRSIYKKNADKRVPLNVMIELTYGCNFKCVHCYNPEDKTKKELTKDEVFSILDQLADIGTMRVSFTGGEIFTRPDIMDIILYARKRGLRVTVMTNGSLVTEEIADQLISLGVSKFEISFLGGTKETFDKITQVEGSYDTVISVIKMLRKKGIIPQVKTCVTKVNLQEIDEIRNLAKELDVLFRYSPLVIPRIDLGQEPGQLRIDPEEFMDLKEQSMKWRKGKATKSKKVKKRKVEEKPGFWERDCIFNCLVGRTGTFIDPQGRMKPCMTVPEPSSNVLEKGVNEGWEKIKEFVDTIKPSPDWECYKCEYRDWCSWCPGRGYLNTGDIFGCPPYYKELAKARMERYEKKDKR